MKILILANIPSPYRIDFYEELNRYVDVTVLFERKRATDRNKLWNLKKNFTFRSLFLKVLPIGSDASIGLHILRYLNKTQYDVFLFSGISSPTSVIAIAYCRLKKIPYIISTDGAFIKDEFFYKKLLKHFLISGASSWLCTGRNSFQYLLKYGASSNNTYVYNFTSLQARHILPQVISKNEKELLKQQLGLNESKIVLSVGQFIYRKGFDLLISACANISENIGVYIIGGKPIEKYFRIIRKLNLTNINFIDFTPKDELIKFYKAADLFVFPTRYDIWGLAINEAMSFGLPVISTNKCNAAIELVENGVNGFIVESENEYDLHNHIINILNDEDLLKSMSEKSLCRIKDYTIENMVKTHLLVFNKHMKKENRQKTIS